MNRPYFELCRPYSECERMALPIIRRKEQATCAEFAFPIWALEETFQDVIWDVRGYLRVLDSLSTSFIVDPGSEPVATYRNVIQHRLLSVPKSPNNTLREACRLGVMIFAYGVTFPFQNTAPMLTYAKTLRQVLLGADQEQFDDDFELWLLVIGAMATFETDMAHWYAEAIRKVTCKMGFKSWATLKQTMQRFLWFEPSCNEGALELWVECLSGD